MAARPGLSRAGLLELSALEMARERDLPRAYSSSD